MRVNERIDEYLIEVRNRPLLTQERELDLARQVAEFRAVCRRHVLGSDGVLRQVIEALRRIANGDLPWDRTVGTTRGGGTRQESAERLSGQVSELQILLDQNREDFLLWLQRPSRRLSSLLASRRKAALLIVDQFPLHASKLRPLMLKLERAATRMTELEAQLAVLGRSGCSEDAVRLKAELYGYHLHMLENAASVHERAQLAGQAFLQYHTAKEALAGGNLRLAAHSAMKHCGRGVPLPDLIQEANVGLLYAIDKFDWTRGFKFSTYATYWIRQAIRDALSTKSRLIREPYGETGAVKGLWKAFGELTQRTGRKPTVKELAEDVGLPEQEASFRLRQRCVASLCRTSNATKSWHSWADDLEDEKADDPAQGAIQLELHDQLEASFRFLTYREREIVKLRFGLSGGYTYTLDEVSRIFKLTRERVRKIEEAALEKMRHPSCCGSLKEFMEPVEA